MCCASNWESNPWDRAAFGLRRSEIVEWPWNANVDCSPSRVFTTRGSMYRATATSGRRWWSVPPRPIVHWFWCQLMEEWTKKFASFAKSCHGFWGQWWSRLHFLSAKWMRLATLSPSMTRSLGISRTSCSARLAGRAKWWIAFLFCQSLPCRTTTSCKRPTKWDGGPGSTYSVC